MTILDLGPAAQRMTTLLDGVTDLDGPTPCADTSVGDLLDHVDGLSTAFAMAAQKVGGDQRASADASKLGDDWRARIPERLATLAEAWRDPEAWTGMTKAGGVELPGELGGVVALDELVIHGWDLAKATGQAFEVDDETLAACHGFVAQFSGPGQEASREGLFGPPVVVPDDAPLLDRLIGLSGRDPGWSPG
ncbi:MAG: TIGR03086 family metal-binding protein [Ilumatobacteraceae bacterium]